MGHVDRAHGVVVSRPLSMREALGSIPSVSKSPTIHNDPFTCRVDSALFPKFVCFPPVLVKSLSRLFFLCYVSMDWCVFLQGPLFCKAHRAIKCKRCLFTQFS